MALAMVPTLTDATFGNVCFAFETFDPQDKRRLYGSHQILAKMSPYFDTCNAPTQKT